MYSSSSSPDKLSLLVVLPPDDYNIEPTPEFLQKLVAEHLYTYLARTDKYKSKGLRWHSLAEECRKIYEANEPIYKSSNKLVSKKPQASYSSWEEMATGYYRVLKSDQDFGIWANPLAQFQNACVGLGFEGGLVLRNKYQASRQRGTLSNVFDVGDEFNADYAAAEDVDFEAMGDRGATHLNTFAHSYVEWQQGDENPEFEKEMKSLGLMILANKRAMREYAHLVEKAETATQKANLKRFEPEEIWSWPDADTVEEFIEHCGWQWAFHTTAVLDIHGKWISAPDDKRKWAENFYTRFLEKEGENILSVVGYTQPASILEQCLHRT